jgi:hypothetical protein
MNYKVYLAAAGWTFVVYDNEWMEAKRESGFLCEADAQHAAAKFIACERVTSGGLTRFSRLS